MRRFSKTASHAGLIRRPNLRPGKAATLHPAGLLHRWLKGSVRSPFLLENPISDITPGHFTGRNLMKRTIIGAMFVAVTALSLSGCFESEAETKADDKPASGEKLWNIPKPDRSKDKGFTP